ncbi:hypothetical protein ACIBTV_27530 [Micromonospora sp. NPDC049366]|uniref:hypothetical protein n=1 Tax=Micromonospora sp. NPDC049366 TaxID=3364271 RepID=UPI0037978BE6
MAPPGTSADDRGALRPPAGDEITGRLRTQTGPRTTAPMWARPFLTDGEWAVYTALWSFASWNGDSTFPNHQALADRAWGERGSAANAVRKFARLGLLTRARQTRADGSDTSNDYMLVEVCPPALLEKLTKLMAERIADQERKRKARRKANRNNAAAVRRRRAGTADGAAEDADAAEDQDDTAGETGDGAVAAMVAALAGEGALPDAPPGVHHAMHPRGTPPDVPGYTTESTHDLSLDLPNDEQPIPRADGAADAAAAPEPGEAATRGGDFPFDEKTKADLNAAVDRVVTARTGQSGWEVYRVRRAVRVCLDAGDNPADVIAALDYVTDDKATRSAGRLPHVVAFLVREREADAAAAARAAAPSAAETPPWAEGAVRYIDPDRPKCRKHPGHPADNCAQCPVDARIAAAEARIAAEDGAAEAEPDDRTASQRRAAAQAAARAAAAHAKEAAPRIREGRKTRAVPRQAEPVDLPPADPATEPALEPVGAAT